eukprot:TRINITY_DN3086_c3_g1_i1.p1 TRINITY_DN3086_c3_g1~~TRINITY_DN3086_c3_g1_i1.p1  ORF type:complete len:719 (-),score=143.52 TRINITY_DN3086_c3_g1_i1:212-2368(-)
MYGSTGVPASPVNDGCSTPEHWSDVGAVRTRVALVEQQLEMLQRQVSDMSSYFAQMNQQFQHLDLQMTMQRQQHQEDIVKIMAAQAMTLSNFSATNSQLAYQAAATSYPSPCPAPKPKVRPGPRERQKLREAKAAAAEAWAEEQQEDEAATDVPETLPAVTAVTATAATATAAISVTATTAVTGTTATATAASPLQNESEAITSGSTNATVCTTTGTSASCDATPVSHAGSDESSNNNSNNNNDSNNNSNSHPAADIDDGKIASGCNWKVGTTVEVRNADEQVWQLGTVASIEPTLTVIAEDDMMAFRYEQVRPLTDCFDIGADVEVRNEDDHSWERGTIASKNPVTVFTGNNAVALEYKQVKRITEVASTEQSSKILANTTHEPESGRSSSEKFAFLRTFGCFIALLVTFSSFRHSPDMSLSNLEAARQWAQSEDSSARQEDNNFRRVPGDQLTVQRMRELGHLRLSLSDCEGADRWFTLAISELDSRNRGHGNNNSTNANADSVLSAVDLKERSEILAEAGFAQICDLRFLQGSESLNEAFALKSDFGGEPPHLINALGYAYFKVKDYARAHEIFGGMTNTYPENPLLWNNLGSALSLRGQYSDAEAALYNALWYAEKLSSHSRLHYKQVISNNIHILKNLMAGKTSMAPSVELFNCMASQVSSLVTSTRQEEFQKTFEDLSLSLPADVERPDVSDLMNARSTVLGLERDFLLCPQ